MRGTDIVANRVALRHRRLHRIGRGALLGKVHDGGRLDIAQEPNELVEVLAQCQIAIADRLAGDLLPFIEALANRGDGSERIRSEIKINFSSRKIIYDSNFVSKIREV